MIFAPELSDDLVRLVEDRGLVHRTGTVTKADVAGCILAFCASEDGAINEHVRALATACGVPVNVADRPDLCQFTMPAILDRDGIVVAFSSGGQAPLLARMLKARLESQVPMAYGRLARFAGSWRVRVAERLNSFDLRRRLWESVFEGLVAELIFAGRKDEAELAMEARLAEAAAGDGAAAGEVYLVGAGPGDPDLLTFRALRLMQKAEVVFYDRSIGDGILNLVRRDAERIFIGKGPLDHTPPCEEISGRMLSLAREGRRVLRLMGGDPFIFGRGGEEIEPLARAGIPFQVVPGVTAANGCAVFAGIPLTHRDHAHACVFVSPHGPSGLNWELLIQPMQTVVIHMGLSSLSRIVEDYVAKGGDPAFPAAIVENGTRPDQRVVSGPFGELPTMAAVAGLSHPALIIIGSVVTLRETLAPSGVVGET